MQLSTYPALLLNADFRPLSMFPLSLMDWQTTIKNVYEGNLSVVAEYDREVRSPSIAMKVPSVVALRRYIPIPDRVAFTRFNVFLRDHFKCQYCGNLFKSSELTFDHVIPRSRGGETSWENVVAACDPCNLRKGNQIGMKPRAIPRKPTSHELMAVKKRYPPKFLHETWLDFVYWDSPLET